MIALLSKWLIKNRDNVSDPEVRRSYGVLAGGVGIFFNLLLFLLKLFTGIHAASISVIGDAFNNLSDAGSSIVTLIGFRVAGKKPDTDHPFGHGRIEYISGFIVSAAILLMGVELAKSSVAKIRNPELVETGLAATVILVFAICVKLYMCFYQRRLAGKLHSSAMRATATDSLSDAAATGVVLVSLLIQRFFQIKIDGWCGLLVALFILYAGVSAAKDTLSPLLGNPPEPELVERIRTIVLSHPEVIGMHDLIVHDYGPGRIMVSLHGEVDGSGDVFALHDQIDHIERELEEELGCSAVIHMDPVETDNEAVGKLKQEAEEAAAQMHASLSIHDFRIVSRRSGMLILFDLVVPPAARINSEEAVKTLTDTLQEAHPEYRIQIRVDNTEII